MFQGRRERMAEGSILESECQTFESAATAGSEFADAVFRDQMVERVQVEHWMPEDPMYKDWTYKDWTLECRSLASITAGYQELAAAGVGRRLRQDLAVQRHWMRGPGLSWLPGLRLAPGTRTFALEVVDFAPQTMAASKPVK